MRRSELILSDITCSKDFLEGHPNSQEDAARIRFLMAILGHKSLEQKSIALSFESGCNLRQAPRIATHTTLCPQE